MRLITSELTGESPVIVALREEIENVAQSDAKVLISGESGSGKEVVARAIHARSPRAARPFAALNCAGMPETLLESELFGHVKGSFTGAYRDKAGTLELADNGTMFLDEVGEMTLRMQGMLLRFLETGELQKVGLDRGASVVDVRIVAATNRRIDEMVDRGEFRDDLFYRLNVVHLAVPPLRERREDIPLLIKHTFDRLTGRNRDTGDGPYFGVAAGFEADAMRVLCDYAWPGNVRELQNVVERLLVTGRHPLIRVEDLPVEVRNGRPPARPLQAPRRTVADDLYHRVVDGRESFWTAVYPLYMNREITKAHVREVVGKGLEEARGNYKIVARLFNMQPSDYKRFLNFLRKHECQVPFREYR